MHMRHTGDVSIHAWVFSLLRKSLEISSQEGLSRVAPHFCSVLFFVVCLSFELGSTGLAKLAAKWAVPGSVRRREACLTEDMVEEICCEMLHFPFLL